MCPNKVFNLTFFIYFYIACEKPPVQEDNLRGPVKWGFSVCFSPTTYSSQGGLILVEPISQILFPNLSFWVSTFLNTPIIESSIDFPPSTSGWPLAHSPWIFLVAAPNFQLHEHPLSTVSLFHRWPLDLDLCPHPIPLKIFPIHQLSSVHLFLWLHTYLSQQCFLFFSVSLTQHQTLSQILKSCRRM